jgi:hypothetical protein
MQQILALRAEWLVCLAEAIDGAQQVAWRLRTVDSASGDARELYTRLEQARAELESLRGVAARSAQSLDSDWVEKLGWSSALLDPAD